MRSSGANSSKKLSIAPEVLAAYQAERLAAGEEETKSPQPPRKIGESLEHLLLVPSQEPVTVLVWLEDAEAPSLIYRIEEDLKAGRITTYRDYAARRNFHLTEQQARVRALQNQLTPALRAAQASIVRRCRNMPCLEISIAPPRVDQLSRSTLVSRLDLDEDGEDSDADITGELVLAGTQIKQFVDSGFDGENSTSSDLVAAIVEIDDFNDGHPIFRDTSSSSSTRIDGRYACDTNPCTAVSSYASPVNHATGVAGLILGDLLDGQDSGQTSTADRTARSGYSGEAHAILYTAGGFTSGTERAFDHIVSLQPKPALANRSGGSETNDPSCLGASTLNQAANALYEAGILLIKTAGNDGHSSATDCTLSSPGAAIGVFTVGGHGTGTTGTEDDVRSDVIYSNSSRGGTSAEGNNRSIVDVTAYAGRRLMPDDSGGYTYSATGTSFAAPTVAAGAIDFIDFYKNTYSNLIDNPGILYANLLLMGDRQGESGKLSSGFDNLWGGGRFKMRRFDTSGLDAPYQWRTGHVCVGHNQAVTVTINDGAQISSGADDFKAVIYWYDRRHQDGTTIDNIDLRLKSTSGTTLASSLSGSDNKERVYHGAIGGQTVELEIQGVSVTSDLEGCGSDSMRVYYAFFFEDDARDDANGPGLEIDRE